MFIELGTLFGLLPKITHNNMAFILEKKEELAIHNKKESEQAII